MCSAHDHPPYAREIEGIALVIQRQQRMLEAAESRGDWRRVTYLARSIDRSMTTMERLKGAAK